MASIPVAPPASNDGGGPAAPQVAGQRTLDVIVQSCTVGLLHASGVAAAPGPQGASSIPPGSSSAAMAVGAISFRAQGFEGTLELCVPEAVLTRIGSRDLGAHGMRDLIRELTNQLMGRLKNKLLQFQIAVDVGMPVALPSRARQSERPNDGITRREYEFRTRQGVAAVVLAGKFDFSVFVFSNHVVLSNEGDVILF